MSSIKKTIKVASGVICQSNKLLIAKRSEGQKLAGLWEFPGGKIEPGENEKDCLERELLEELGVKAEIGEFIAQTDYEYDFAVVSLFFYWAKIKEGELQNHVHEELKWVEFKELPTDDFVPADIPVLAQISKAFETIS